MKTIKFNGCNTIRINKLTKETVPCLKVDNKRKTILTILLTQIHTKNTI